METKALAVGSYQGNIPAERFSADWDNIMKIAGAICKSGLVPTGMATPEKLTVVMMSAREIGIPMMMATRTLFVIDQKVAMMSQVMLAKIHQSGVAEDVKIEDGVDGCTVTMKRKGMSPYTTSFTLKDAQRAGLTSKDNYKKYGPDMYRSRAISKCARVVFPDVIGGLYTPEEVKESIDVDEAAIDVAVSAEKTDPTVYKDSRDLFMEQFEQDLSNMEKESDVSQWKRAHQKEISGLLDQDRESVEAKLQARFQELVTGIPATAKEPDPSAFQRYIDAARANKTVDELKKWFKENKAEIDRALIPADYTKLLDELSKIKAEIFNQEMNAKHEESVQIAAKIFDELQKIDDKAVFDKYVKEHQKEISGLMPDQKEWIEQEIKSIRDMILEG